MKPIEFQSFENAQAFAASDVDRVPEVVGIYAWYGVLDAGRKDWELENVDGVDAGQHRLLKLLQYHSARHASPPLRITALSRLAASWSGELESDAGNNLSEMLAGVKDGEEAGLAAISTALKSPALREAMVQALHAATPVLSSPLYVGISVNLRERLNRHVNQVRRARAVVARSPDARQRLLEEGRNFATRAVGSGFDVESLLVWVVKLEDMFRDRLDKNEARIVAEATEWLLNRWHRPPLGKR